MRLYFDVAVSRWHTDRTTTEEPRVERIAWWADDRPAAVCRLIRPLPGMTIDPSTARYHGLTVEDLKAGCDPALAIAELEEAAQKALTIVSFNAEFHWRNLHRLMGHAG